jgi:hypothetical protein
MLNSPSAIANRFVQRISARRGFPRRCDGGCLRVFASCCNTGPLSRYICVGGEEARYSRLLKVAY